MVSPDYYLLKLFYNQSCMGIYKLLLDLMCLIYGNEILVRSQTCPDIHRQETFERRENRKFHVRGKVRVSLFIIFPAIEIIYVRISSKILILPDY